MLVANLLTTRVFHPYFRDFIKENVKVFDVTTPPQQNTNDTKLRIARIARRQRIELRMTRI